MRVIKRKLSPRESRVFLASPLPQGRPSFGAARRIPGRNARRARGEEVGAAQTFFRGFGKGLLHTLFGFSNMFRAQILLGNHAEDVFMTSFNRNPKYTNISVIE